ncbi:T9SS type A sorting domain-containing protein [Flavobacterium litorale]|uniref:T9SS type A sorting domain-containing protein n=1 Tax=Flavobacterium litorale TaxID=2856519 RepID=A0ABX8V582_9FLAO|nr:T9SS type A sorting domain-containing protein [Flavobacterium litorale]QYJ67999.1 T9SS type A sorting domain-containing protein [Flavobacterium litorale]
MKKILLSLLTFMLFIANMQAQAIAYQPDDILQCGFEIFDLSAQTPVVLGNQNSNDFTVAYFTSEEDATDNTNPILNPSEYIGQQSEIIYVRVTNNSDDTFDTTSFLIGFGVGWVPAMDDVYACDGYALPPLQFGNYFSGPAGSGIMYAVGDLIQETQMVYVYYEDFGCLQEEAFDVYIENLFITELPPLVGCVSGDESTYVFDLTSVIPIVLNGIAEGDVAFFTTEEDALMGTNQINNPLQYTSTTLTQTIYVTLYVNDCIAVAPLDLIVDDNCTGNTVLGTITYDIDNNGCNATDILASGILVSLVNNNDVYYTYTNANGEYYFYNVPDGDSTISVAQSSGISYTSVPSSYTIIVSEEQDPLDFCLTVSNPVNDVAVTLVPTTLAIPGFLSSYVIVYENMGVLPASGVVSLTFDSTMMTFDSALPAMQQAGNTLTLQYDNLMPFQSGYIVVDFLVMQPPTVNSGDILDFAAIIDANLDDDFSNNISELSQTVVNSFDPNDIRVHEGEYISEEQAEEYLHYTIRFQNEGTANATNVRIDTELDANLDWSTFEPIVGSHNYVTARNGENVSFIFNNIDLPYTDIDVPGSQGYVTYKIKPADGVTIGDVMEATAGIYFDFNEAIITNTATTTVQATASSAAFASNAFVVYPNPASTSVTLKMENLNGDAMVNVTDILGKTVLSTTASGNELNLDISMLNSGMYFITLEAAGKSITKKIVVQ